MKLIHALLLSLSLFVVAPAYAAEFEAPVQSEEHTIQPEIQAGFWEEVDSARDWLRNRCIRRCQDKFRECMWKDRPESYCRVRRNICVHDCNN